jgi:hypothetical protein
MIDISWKIHPTLILVNAGISALRPASRTAAAPDVPHGPPSR